MFKKFFKNKTVGYYIAAFVAVLALVTLIVFFAKYNNPDVTTVMGNKAESFVPVTIGIFLLAGFVVQLVVLFVPEFRLFQIAAVVMFGMALYKDILIIADFLAGLFTNVMYNGGDVNFNMFIFISILIICIAAVVTTFMGLVKEVPEEEEEDEEEEVVENNQAVNNNDEEEEEEEDNE